MLRSLLHEQRESARAAMLEMLDSRRYEAFVGRFGRTLRARHLARSGPASRPARALAPDLIESRFRAVRKAGARIGPASPAADYHRLRIRCKRLRYALEFLADLYPGETRPLIGRLVTVQDVLGLHQDADVAIERLRHLAVIVQRRPRPRDDLRHGRGRRALPAVDDRATSAVPGRVRSALRQAVEGVPQTARTRASSAAPSGRRRTGGTGARGSAGRLGPRAAGVGFEPTGLLPGQRFSRPPRLTAPAPRRGLPSNSSTRELVLVRERRS